MKEKYIIIEVNKEGSISAETFNMEGIDCVDELNKLMKDLAMCTEEQKKPEYFKEKVLKQGKVSISK